jgi:hypothetical protein
MVQIRIIAWYRLRGNFHGTEKDGNAGECRRHKGNMHMAYEDNNRF